jgi:hypothetical protein
LKLEENLNTPEKVTAFTEFLDLIGNQVAQFNDVIPAEILNSQIRVYGPVTFYDNKTAPICDALKTLRILVSTR